MLCCAIIILITRFQTVQTRTASSHVGNKPLGFLRRQQTIEQLKQEIENAETHQKHDPHASQATQAALAPHVQNQHQAKGSSKKTLQSLPLVASPHVAPPSTSSSSHTEPALISSVTVEILAIGLQTLNGKSKVNMKSGCGLFHTQQLNHPLRK